MKLLSKHHKLPQYFIKKFKLGRLSWFVRADVIDYNLSFQYKWQADQYKTLLGMSVSKIRAKVERVQVDDETGLHITYPKED